MLITNKDKEKPTTQEFTLIVLTVELKPDFTTEDLLKASHNDDQCTLTFRGHHDDIIEHLGGNKQFDNFVSITGYLKGTAHTDGLLDYEELTKYEAHKVIKTFLKEHKEEKKTERELKMES